MEENKQALQEQERESQEEAENAVENESKSEKFIRLAQSRVTKASVAISRIAYLANTNAYDYTPEQVEQMFLALEQELSQVKVQFQKTEKTKKAFSFQ
jgi:glycyl-tRNA synthetase (class II)